MVEYPEHYQLWGGYMPFPPEDCVYREHAFKDKESKIVWIDNYWCSQGQCSCSRRKEYTARNNEEWRREVQRLCPKSAKRNTFDVTTDTREVGENA